MAMKDSYEEEAPVVVADETGLVLPDGHWRDNLCDCCAFGCCHQTICCGIFCEPVLLAQVMTRLRLTWQGASGGDYKNTFKIVVLALIGYVVSVNVLQYIEAGINAADKREAIENNVEYELPMSYHVLTGISSVISCVFWLFMLYIITNTRRHIRTKSNIPEKHCSGCEDCCCALFCSCCTITQMARHTVDYNVQKASCCNGTGLSGVTV